MHDTLFSGVSTKEKLPKLTEGHTLKKLVAALFAATLVFSSVGSFVFNDQATTVEAKGYKSGKKGFNTNKNYNNNQPTNSNIQKDKQDTKTNNGTSATKSGGGFMKGGLMKGLMLGGLAGLLFGGLFGNMGALGSILGFAINILAIIVLIALVRKVFTMIKAKKRKEEANPWNR